MLHSLSLRDTCCIGGRVLTATIRVDTTVTLCGGLILGSPPSSGGGTVRPSILAVSAFMTCSVMGRSKCPLANRLLLND